MSGRKEIYLHYYSKKLITKWLKGFISINNNFKQKIKFTDFKVIDEYCLTAESSKKNWKELGFKTHNPIYEEVTAKGFKVLRVVDLMLLDENKPKYIFEICHTNKLNPKKVQNLIDLGFKNMIFELDCMWIMTRLNIPDYCKFSDWF